MIDKVKVVRDNKARRLYIVKMAPEAAPDRLFRAIGPAVGPSADEAVVLTGDPEQTRRIFEVPEGSKIVGTFVYRQGSHTLLVGQIEP